MYLYSIEWSHGMSQKNLPKTEAMSLARELLIDHDEVILKKHLNWQS